MCKKFVGWLFAAVTPLWVSAQQEAITLKGDTILIYSDRSWAFPQEDPLYLLKPDKADSLLYQRSHANRQVIKHLAFIASFDPAQRQSAWVSYLLTAEHTKATVERVANFRADTDVPGGTATNDDYLGSGLDRGHLAPAANMAWSEQAMSESFLYSNISPQDPAFNRGIWKRLEAQVTEWARSNDSLYVVSGPVFSDEMDVIGPGQLPVPQRFFKVVLDYRTPGLKAIGFLLDNEKSDVPLISTAIPVDSVEAVTGIDFFFGLRDDQEALIERTCDVRTWEWKGILEIDTEDIAKGDSLMVCKGITRTGTACKIKTRNVNGYCHFHQDQFLLAPLSGNEERRDVSVQCLAITAAGTRCKNMTFSPNGKCHVHGGD